MLTHSLHRRGPGIILLVIFLNIAVQTAWAAAEEEEAPAQEPAPVATPKPKSRTGGGNLESQLKAVNAKLEKQGRDLATLKVENGKLRDQIKLLYSIVNKLAGLQSGK
jgi:hypothetical protein